MSKKVMGQLRKIVAKGAFAISVFSANSTCLFWTHQPKQPKTVNQLRKF